MLRVREAMISSTHPRGRGLILVASVAVGLLAGACAGAGAAPSASPLVSPSPSLQATHAPAITPPAIPSPSASSNPSPGPSPTASQSALRPMGISRATIIAAIDRELGKGMIEWQAEATFPDGGVYVDGATPIFGDPPERTIRLFGPAGNVTGLGLFDPPAAPVKAARR